MATLRTLPDELLDIVFNCLDRKHDQESIRALRATDRRCCRLIASRRWVTVAEPDHDHMRYGSCCVLSRSCLRKWACKVAHQPEFACLIKEIREPYRLHDWDEDDPAVEIARQPIEQWAAALERSGLSTSLQKRVYDRLVEDPHGAYLAFLLAMCKHTEVLELGLAPSGTGDLASQVLLEGLLSPVTEQSKAQLASPIRIADSIRTLRIAQSSATTELLPLLRLPHLQTLEMPYLSDCDDIEEHNVNVATTRHRGSKPLRFWSDICAIGHNGLRQILIAAAPTSLALRWIDDTATDHIQSYLPLGDTIRSHGATLEQLHLDMTLLYYAGHDPMDRSASYGSFGSFKQLPMLRSLAVSMHAFIEFFHDPVSFLPPSLEELYILGVGKDLRTFNFSDGFNEEEDEDDENQDDGGTAGSSQELSPDDGTGNEEGHHEEESDGDHDHVHPAESNEDHPTDTLHANDPEAASFTDSPVAEGPNAPNAPATGEAGASEEDLCDDEHVERVVIALQNASIRLPRLRRIVRVPWRSWRRWPEDNVDRCVDYEASGELPFHNMEYLPGTDVRDHIAVT